VHGVRRSSGEIGYGNEPPNADLERSIVAAYVIAHLQVLDPERYDAYAANFLPILTRHGGRLLMVDEAVDVLEGPPAPGRHVVLQFEDRDAAHRWYQSPEYQAILGHRLAASTTHCVLIGQTPPEIAARIEGRMT
jgi:uncharacterized protein (DUF1330 family)